MKYVFYDICDECNEVQFHLLEFVKKAEYDRDIQSIQVCNSCIEKASRILAKEKKSYDKRNKSLKL